MKNLYFQKKSQEDVESSTYALTYAVAQQLFFMEKKGNFSY